jgi:DNA-binding NarL/FixJ family response regulator
MRLGALVDAVAAGHGRVVVLEGEAGIGKSRLADEVLAACADRGFGVFSGVADEVEQRRPFGVICDALRVRVGVGGARREIVRLLDGIGAGVGGGGAGGFGLEARIADLLVGVAVDACREGPVVALLDDLQWADESSLVAVSGIARAAASYRLLMVCSLRRYPAAGPLRALLASLDYRRAHRVGLEGLAAGQVVELASGLVGAPPGDSLREALEEAGGNPFYVSELLACLQREGSVGVSEDGLMEVTAAGLPPSIGLTVLEQLRFLPDETLEVLRAAAVAGRAFLLSDVALISPSSVSDVAAALAPAQRAGIVVADGERLSFRHDLIREAIHGDLAPAVRRGLHRHLASRLAESGTSPVQVAAQLMLGAERGDVEAIGWLRRAAGEAAAASPVIAIELLERALELAGEKSPVRVEVLGELVRPLLWTGRAARAERVCVGGLEARVSGDAEALFWVGLVTARLLQGRFVEAQASGEQAVGCEGLTESDRLGLSTARALCGVHLGDLGAVEQARRIVDTAPRSISRGTALDAVAQWEFLTGRADRAVALWERREQVVSPVELENRIWEGSGIRVRMWHALALLDLDRLEQAAGLLEQDIAAKLAVPALPHAFLGACRYHQGRFERALEECRAAVAAAEAAGSFAPASALALSATIALRRGELEQAEQLTAGAERVRTAVELGGDTIVRWTRTLLHEARGETEQAADAGVSALEAYTRAGFASYLAWHAPDLVRVALAAGRPAQAELAVQAAERVAGQLPVSSRRAGWLRARGLLTGEVDLLEQAVAACRQVPRPVDLAMCLRDAAAAHARAGEHEQARPLAGEALELLAGLGAVGDQRHARALLRAAGLTLSARAKHTRARHGWESLTEGELRVVRLAAEGHTNPQIAQALYLSKRTVGWHLSNVFRKLGVSSRVELVAEALRRELR